MATLTRKILLAIDGSDQAFEAARYVSQLFAPNRIDVVLFHVATKVPESFWDIEEDPQLMIKEASLSDWEHQQKEKIQELMERARQLFVDRGVPEDLVKAKIQERKVGIARDIICESQHDYNAVAVGRWGMSLLKDFLWGSIADKLIGRLTHVPLCVVGGTPQIGRILMALDTSEGAMRAADYVGTMVSADLEVTLFHAVRSPDEEIFHKAEESMDLFLRKPPVVWRRLALVATKSPPGWRLEYSVGPELLLKKRCRVDMEPLLWGEEVFPRWKSSQWAG